MLRNTRRLGGNGHQRSRVAYVRVEDPSYPRNARIRAFLRNDGYAVDIFPRAKSGSLLRRLLADIWMILIRMHGYDVYVVSEFSLRFAPLVRLVAHLNSALCIVDFFVGKEETVVDHKGAPGHRPLRSHLAQLEDRAAARAGHLLLIDTRFRAAALTQKFQRRVVSLPVGAPAWARPGNVIGENAPRNPLQVLFYGSFLPLHGVHTILEAIAIAGSFAHLTLVGDVRDRDVKERIASLGIAPRCTIVQPVPAVDLAEYIKRSDVVLGVFGTSPKAHSVIANKVWQGLACGRPVITQTSPALVEIRDIVGDQLVEIPPGDAASLADALRRRLNAPNSSPLWNIAGERLEQYVQTEFHAFGKALHE